MSDHSYPKYEAFPLKDGGGWYIVVTPKKHGASYEIYGLASETEARDWIEDLRDEHHAARRFSGAAETGQSKDQRNKSGCDPISALVGRSE
jgi:hypothetical protein